MHIIWLLRTPEVLELILASRGCMLSGELVCRCIENYARYETEQPTNLFSQHVSCHRHCITLASLHLPLESVFPMQMNFLYIVEAQ